MSEKSSESVSFISKKAELAEIIRYALIQNGAESEYGINCSRLAQLYVDLVCTQLPEILCDDSLYGHNECIAAALVLAIATTIVEIGHPARVPLGLALGDLVNKILDDSALQPRNELEQESLKVASNIFLEIAVEIGEEVFGIASET